jgi:hypothetical protein
MRARFNIYEIEHQGDEQQSLEDLQNAGCTNIMVFMRDYEGAEAIRVECDLPDNVTSPNQLKLEYACL